MCNLFSWTIYYLYSSGSSSHWSCWNRISTIKVWIFFKIRGIQKWANSWRSTFVRIYRIQATSPRSRFTGIEKWTNPKSFANICRIQTSPGFERPDKKWTKPWKSYSIICRIQTNPWFRGFEKWTESNSNICRAQTNPGFSGIEKWTKASKSSTSMYLLNSQVIHLFVGSKLFMNVFKYGFHYCIALATASKSGSSIYGHC